MSNGTGRVRELNERAVLACLDDTSHRVSDIAVRTGLTRPTVTGALTSLTAKGWVRRTSDPDPGLGRPATAYARAPLPGHVAALDTGLQRTFVLVRALDGSSEHRRVVEYRPDLAPDARIHQAHQGLVETLRDAGLDTDDLWLTRAEATAVAYPGLRADDIDAMLRARLSGPLRTHMRPYALARNEARQLHDGNVLLYAWVGRRPTVSIVLDGEPILGDHGTAGDLAGLDTTRPRTRSFGLPFWPPPGVPHRDWDEVAAAAMDDADPDATGAILTWFTAFSPALVALTAGVDPTVVVLGGPLARLGSVLADRLTADLEQALPHPPEVEVRPFTPWSVAEAVAADAREDVITTLLTHGSAIPELTRESFLTCFADHSRPDHTSSQLT